MLTISGVNFPVIFWKFDWKNDKKDQESQNEMPVLYVSGEVDVICGLFQSTWLVSREQDIVSRVQEN